MIKSAGNSSSGEDDSGSSGTLSYLDGKNFTNSDVTKHDLGKTGKGVTAEAIDKWINAVAPSNSKMRGLGKTYIKAGKESGLDPRYLVAHSAVETGWGTSNLSRSGNVEKGNWYGIGAFDNNPNNGFNYGSGIVGGAKWIRNNFYDKGQKTLKTMRHNGGQHEYATDPNWDRTIASIMKGSEKYIAGGGGRDFDKEINTKVVPTKKEPSNKTYSKNISIDIPGHYSDERISKIIYERVLQEMK